MRQLNPEPPFTGASTTDIDPISPTDAAAIFQVKRTDEQRLHDAMTATVGDGHGFRRGIPDSVSWEDVTAFYDETLGSYGMRRDTTFRAYPVGHLSEAGLWTFPDAPGVAVGVALIQTRRPSTGRIDQEILTLTR